MAQNTSEQPTGQSSRTQTETLRSPQIIQQGTIQLQTQPDAQTIASHSRHVSWTEETVDNELLNKKKSKVCCIFHAKDDDECGCEPDPDAWNAYERQPKPPQ